VIFTPNILIAGARDKADVLLDLSLRLYITDSGRAAIQCLKSRKIDTVISRWELADFGNGEFLKNVIGAKPGILTAAIIKAGDYRQEVSARSMGATVVLPENIDDAHFRKVICRLVNILDMPTDKTEQKSTEYVAADV
jgi:DNA-binding NtrC family response regulator